MVAATCDGCSSVLIVTVRPPAAEQIVPRIASAVGSMWRIAANKRCMLAGSHNGSAAAKLIEVEGGDLRPLPRGLPAWAEQTSAQHAEGQANAQFQFELIAVALR